MRFVRLVVLLLTSAVGAFCQATEGSILGTVLDPSGAPVSGASITVTGVNTGLIRNTTTDETGGYVVAALPIGTYSVSAEQQGFKKAVFPEVEITVKARVRADLRLEVGQLSETVSVTGAAPLLKTDTIEVSNLLSRVQLQSLPVINRHFLNLSILTPNVVRLPTGRQADLGGDSFAVGTVGPDQNNYNLNASRANLVLSAGPANLPNEQRTINRWFNVVAFSTPPNFTWGNSGVNILDGPGFAQVDFALQKMFSVREGVALQFRSEASNLFNRVNLGLPGSTIGGSAYGAIRSLRGEPRNLQMALRLQF